MATTSDNRQSRFEQSVAIALHLWPALSLAVQNQWGGPDSSDKRDWFAGAVVDLFPSFDKSKKPVAATAADADDDEPDVEYVETFLLQVMLDEFEVNVDDESGLEAAQDIVRIRAQCARGKFDEADALKAKWESKSGARAESLFKKVDDDDGDTDWDSDDDGDSDDNDGEDVEMGDAPRLVTTMKEKPAPEVDDDGFTKVTRKR